MAGLIIIIIIIIIITVYSQFRDIVALPIKEI